MRRITWVAAIVVVCLAVVLAGCGKKDAAAVVGDLDHVIKKLASYQGTGKMVLHTGQQPQEYQVEVWYQNPHYYRIMLTNGQRDITQIVLRNEEGVFVLTPHLKKSFRFQSDWPENQGQVYLYQSLVDSIVKDKNRQFTTEEDSYVFEVQANYQNEMLTRQKIWLNKKNLAPQHVEVSDANKNVMVLVEFNQFEFGKKFDKDSFDMERNMTSWNLKSLPTTAGANASGTKAAGKDKSEEGKDAASKTGAASQSGAGSDKQASAGAAGKTADGKPAAASQAGTTSASGKSASFGIIEPSYTPKGVAKQDVTELKLGEEPAVMIRYKGEYSYNLVELRPQAKSVSLPEGEVVDLGYTLAVLSGDSKKTLTWTYDGVEYRLSTADLPKMEMIQVAQAVQGQMGK